MWSCRYYGVIDRNLSLGNKTRSRNRLGNAAKDAFCHALLQNKGVRSMGPLTDLANLNGFTGCKQISELHRLHGTPGLMFSLFRELKYRIDISKRYITIGNGIKRTGIMLWTNLEKCDLIPGKNTRGKRILSRFRSESSSLPFLFVDIGDHRVHAVTNRLLLSILSSLPGLKSV
jgi:hypothetical protein